MIVKAMYHKSKLNGYGGQAYTFLTDLPLHPGDKVRRRSARIRAPLLFPCPARPLEMPFHFSFRFSLKVVILPPGEPR